MDKKKAAAYARVSTNGKMQAHSYEFQSRYWNERLSNDETYEYVGLFADKGISGKFANRRPQFMALMDACKKGEVDVVFTKSVQRFARNTEEMLTIVRELREIGIAVIFEKENINTLNPDSEIFLTIAAAVAEDDLVRYSDNVSWSIQDRFQRGECIIGPRLYGYEVAKATITTINPEEAKVVKEIFERYATGKSSSREIAAWLNERGIPAALGGKWADNQIRAMLRNEKYKGDMLLQKTFLENGMKKTNRGEKDCYYVENSHEPIVDRELWEKVQTIMDARTNKKLQGQVTKLYPFTGMIICGECGHKYTHKVNNSGLIWQANFWKCHNSITHGVKVCGNSWIKESVINDLFVECYNEFIKGGYKTNEGEEGRLQATLDNLYKEENELTMLSIRGLINQRQYENERQALLSEIRATQQKLQDIRYCHLQATDFKAIETFDEEKLHRFVRKVIIHRWVVTFEFYNGVQISRTYTNGQPGNIKDWKLKQKARRELANG